MNKRISIAVAVGLLTSAISGCSDNNDATKYLADAEAQLAAQDVNASIISLKNAIKMEPKNVAARLMLGAIYLDLGNGPQAEKELEKALRLNGDKATVIPLLARAYYLNENNQAILDLNDKTSDLPENVLGRYLLFKSLAHLKFEQKEQSKQALAQIPNNEQSKFNRLLAQAYFNFGEANFEESKSLAHEALALEPKDPEALFLLANLGGLEKEYNIAAEFYRKYLDAQPMMRSIEILLANALLLDEQYQDAEKYADAILKLLPSQPFANYIKAIVSMHNKEYQQANKHAELAIQNKFNQPNIKLVAGASAFYLKKFEQANHYLEPLLKYLPEEHFARRMVIVSQLELGLVENLSDNLTVPVISNEQDAQFYSALSYKLLQHGATSQAQKLMSANPVIDPKNANHLLRDGLMKMLVNDEAALAQLEKAVDIQPDLKNAETAIAYLALRQGDVAKAKAMAFKWQKEFPEKARGYNLEAMIALNRQDPTLAKKQLEKAISVEPKHSFAYVQLAKLAASEKDISKAKSTINNAVELFPDNINVLRQYHVIYRDEQALELLANSAKRNSENDNFKVVLAEALVLQRQVDKALQTLKEIAVDQKTPKLYWKLLVFSYHLQNNETMIEDTLNNWRKMNPYHIEWVYYLTDLYIKKQNIKDALKLVNSSLETHENNLQLNTIKTQLLLQDKQIAQAERHYSSYKDTINEQTTKDFIESRLALANNQLDVALPLLDSVYQAKPSAVNARTLMIALNANKQPEQAIAISEKHLSQFGFDAGLATMLANSYLNAGKRKNALATYQNIAKVQEKNFVALNNAAWLSMEEGNLEQALTYIERAEVINPTEPNVLDTYGKILAGLGKNDLALEKYKKALENAAQQNPEIILNYIELLISLDKNNEAKQRLKSIAVKTEAQRKRKSAYERLLASRS